MIDPWICVGAAFWIGWFTHAQVVKVWLRNRGVDVHALRARRSQNVGIPK